MHPRLTVVDHPLVARHLAVLRDRATDSATFRHTLSDVSMLLLYEALRDLRVREEPVPTPLEDAPAHRLADDIVVVAIMRAGLGMVDGVLRMIPVARIGHIGLYRDEETLEPVTYYEKLPDDLAHRDVFLLDPMLATGGSVTVAVDKVKAAGATHVKLLAILAAPEGIARLQADHPDVDIIVAGIDERLNEKGYIVPGLGDAGDRLFGTK